MKTKGLYIFISFIFFSFIVPLHLFIIGDGNGYGIQGFFYRYQVSSYGISFFPITHEIGYVTSGIIDGKSAISIILWSFGSLSFFLAFFVFLFKVCVTDAEYNSQVSQFIFLSSLFLIISSIMQYGLLFNGPAGISMLIGVPLLIAFGWVISKLISDIFC
jgi:hypothetical protein